jgi:hypothetical protein
MIFTPFAFMAETAAPGAWTPADFTNVQYWFTADAGVTESGGVVSAWTDQINSFQYDNAVNSPTLTTSATLNGQNVISFNGVTQIQYIYASNPIASNGGGDWTVLQVMDVTGAGNNGAFTAYGEVGTSSGRFQNDTFGGNYRHFNQGFGGTYTVESPLTTGAKAWKTRYDTSAGNNYYAVNTLTETLGQSGGTVGQDWAPNGVLVIGTLLNSRSNPTVFGGRWVPVDVAEQVWIYGTPSAAEMTEWKTYVNNKYGTIIV